MPKKNETLAEVKAKQSKTIPPEKAASKSAKASSKAKATSRTPDRNHNNKTRPRREAFKMGGKFDVEQRPGYKRAWPVNREDEIEEMERRDWTKVLGEDGNPITRAAGNGLRHFLMEIPVEYYEEDEAVRQQDIDEKSRAITQLKRGRYSADYVPKGTKRGFAQDKGYYKEVAKEVDSSSEGDYDFEDE